MAMIVLLFCQDTVKLYVMFCYRTFTTTFVKTVADPGGGGGAPGARAPPFRSSNYIFIVAQYSVLNCNLKVQQQKKASALRAEASGGYVGGGGGGGGLIDVQMLQQQESEFSF